MIHISIEGFDGAGKTTYATLLAQKLGFIFVEKPLKYLFAPQGGDSEYLRIRDYMNEVSPNNRPLSACFYGLGNIYLYEKYKEKNIVTDRHILSNFAWSGSPDSEELFDAIYRIIGSPSYIFIVYADEETIYKRLKIRSEKDSDLAKIKKTEEIYCKMQYFAEKHKMPYLLIDTRDKTQDEIASIMINTLKEKDLIE